jgi:hypothetical protein
MAVVFSDRLKLADAFEAWRQEQSRADATISRGAQAVVTWLDIVGLLDEEKVRAFLATAKPVRRCRECPNGTYVSRPTPNWPNRYVCDGCGRIIPDDGSR